MYRISDYGAMITDEARMRAFVEALQRAVGPHSVVVDIGTGTGIFALLACRCGARRVFAIEPGDAIAVARESAAANGFGDRIEFYQARSTDVVLPERADVVIADIGGALPWFQRHIPAMIDARQRLLKPGGVLIPQRDTAWTAVIEDAALHARYLDPWRRDRFGLDLDAARAVAVNAWTTCHPTRDQFLTSCERWGTLDYRDVTDSGVHGRMRWAVRRAGTAHGLAAGFDRIVADGLFLSTAPDVPDEVRPLRIYGTVFFPWPAGVAVTPGDIIEAEISAVLADDDYVWTWKSRVLKAGQDDATSVEFAQSTFLGVPLTRDSLRKRAETYVPALNAEGQAVRLVLEGMREGLSVGELATRLGEAFPQRFARRADALSYVGRLSKDFG